MSRKSSWRDANGSLKHFRFRDNSFLRILEDGKSTAAYVTTGQTSGCDEALSHLVGHLKYGSIIDLLLRRFWWPSMKKDLKDFIARCPECQLDRMHAMLGHGLTTLVHGKRDRWDEYPASSSISTSDSNTRCYWILPFLLFVSVFILVSQLTRPPPRNTLAPLDEIERMEENSEFIARNLEEVVKQDQLQCSNQGTV
ncbi:hypothetical protein BASA81_009970 [Batrachochytrium salamandrivorans]|nr:hypothetical protein BASA81_009970 [Batrachochytrium salamandrivorans]